MDVRPGVESVNARVTERGVVPMATGRLLQSEKSDTADSEPKLRAELLNSIGDLNLPRDGPRRRPRKDQ